jgi:predicted transcriptional regulator of viral defense system
MRDTKQTNPVPKPDRIRLFDIAAQQNGYFTSEQAAESGFSRALLAHHAKSGTFIRVRRGLYRFREYPPSPREHVLAAWLAVGKANAVVSHESALELLGLSDVVPDAVHLTVPRSKRNLPSIAGVKIHTTSRPIGKNDKTTRDGIAVTSASRTILDAAESGVSPEQIEDAVAQAVERGLVMPRELQHAATERGRRVIEVIDRGLAETRA